MNVPAIASLARALAALTAAQSGTDPAALVAAFSVAVAAFDAADAAYRTAIAQTLAPDRAAAMIAELDGFRAAVAALRERTSAATGYGDFDPLDSYVPALPVGHGRSIQIADLADRARAEVATLRAAVNARVGSLLAPEEIAGLTAAKRARNAAFDRALRASLAPGTTDRLATQLLLLADGWY